MRQHLVWIAALAALAPGGAGAEETSWIFSRSAYTHSPVTGQRIAQYCPEQPSFLRYDDTYQQSGYRHNLITIGSGDNADRTNIVQTWGLGLAIRPYGEWERPYRPYATPYSVGRLRGLSEPRDDALQRLAESLRRRPDAARIRAELSARIRSPTVRRAGSRLVSFPTVQGGGAVPGGGPSAGGPGPSGPTPSPPSPAVGSPPAPAPNPHPGP